jgi:hypothetical protein
MALTENSFFQYKETRALSGYKSALLYKDTNLDKYCLICATETAPYVFGDKDNFEFDILQSDTKGKVEGKMSLESKDFEVLHHRDNALRFEKLKGQTLDFMTINGEFMGYKFTGTIDYRPNDAEADINRATVTITPMSAEATPVYDARSQIVETLCFANTIPATVNVNESVDFSVLQSSATVSISVEEYRDGYWGTDATSDAQTTGNYVQFKTAGLYAITVSDEQSNYAPWTTTVYVESAT